MLGKDTEWFVQNRTRISAFQKYITLVETDILPTQVANLLKAAALEATRKIDFDGADWTVLLVSDASDIYVYWFLGGSFNDDTGIGAWIGLKIPKNVEWLGSESDNMLHLALSTYGGAGPKGKGKTKTLGQLADNAIKSLNPKIGKRPKKIDDDDYYCSVERGLGDVLNDSKLAKPGLETELTKVLKDFSNAVLPGLKAVQKYLSDAGR